MKWKHLHLEVRAILVDLILDIDFEGKSVQVPMLKIYGDRIIVFMLTVLKLAFEYL